MAEKVQRRNLGRGLSALIPDVDMEFLSQIVREEPVIAIPSKNSKGNGSKKKLQTKNSGSPANKGTAPSKKPVATAKARATEPASVNGTRTIIDTLNPEDISTDIVSREGSAQPEADDLAAKIEFVPTGSIEANPYQPRRFFSPQELEDLVNSLREHGILQPVILRPLSDDTGNVAGKYQLIAGERRWRAAQTAGLAEIPAIIRPVTDQQALELAIIENVQRQDISALDAAIAYRRLTQEFSLSQEQVAQRVGKSRSSVANTIRLLDLPAEAQRAIEEGVLSEGHGRAILLAPNDGARRAVLRRVLRDKLSVRAAEELARNTSAIDDSSSSDDAPMAKGRLSPEARRIEEGLQKHLGTRVKLKMRRQGGQILINYFSNEELDRLLKLMIK